MPPPAAALPTRSRPRPWSRIVAAHPTRPSPDVRRRPTTSVPSCRVSGCGDVGHERRLGYPAAEVAPAEAAQVELEAAVVPVQAEAQLEAVADAEPTHLGLDGRRQHQPVL